ncbi:recombinase family protein [Methanococcoides sp. AM1]|uniref:recombinase family protein n=1 Tax=Methanococcoides sp. AM1 TaxID=1201011 RepID=UPI001083AE3B|nr:recombinase family protein [Methanococcoides sp. AM1]
MNVKSKVKAGLYIRTSTDNQSESIELQKKELKKYCQAKGYEIVETYIDFGFSGKNTERPAFQNMIQGAEIGKFQILLVTKIDRFARSIIDCLINVEKLESYGVAFAATSQPIDTSSAMGKLTLQIMACFAEFERSIINERMKAGRKAAEQRGVVCHRPRKDIPQRKLEELVGKGLSANACGKFFGVTASTITHRLLEYGYVYENGEWMKSSDSL